MAVPKGCDNYIIQIIVNPCVYWVTKFESGKSYKKEMEKFKQLLAKHVIKLTGCKVPINTLVAVEQDGEFSRGLVTDAFRRSKRITYSVLLVDHGKIIETTKDKIYLIQSKNLRELKSKAVQVTVHGIQPAGLDIDDNNLLNGIFQKRKCSNWSPNAFNFVEKLFKKNPQVFIKVISSKKNILTGDIYYIQESDGMVVSLGQTLCDEGFAVLRDVKKLIISGDSQNDEGRVIEKKIPQNALTQDIEEFEDFRNFSGTSSSSSENTVIESEKFKPVTVTESNINYSSSWILKKCQLNDLIPKTFKEEKTTAEFEPNCSLSKNPEVNLLRVALKAMEHFERRKKEIQERS